MSPGDLAIIPDTGIALVPYTVDAVADRGTVSTVGGAAVANVLASAIREIAMPSNCARATVTLNVSGR